MTRPIDALTREQIHELFKVLPRKSVTGLRGRALLALLYGSAIRVAEAVGSPRSADMDGRPRKPIAPLKPKDIDLQAGTVRIHSGKGNRARTVGILPEFVEHVAAWMDRRSELGLNGRHPVFCTVSTGKVGGSLARKSATKPGRPLSTAQVRGFLARLAARVEEQNPDWASRIHAHGFRHSWAVEAIKQGWSIPEIQAQLGHGSISTTYSYLRGLGAINTAETMKAKGWSVDLEAERRRAEERERDRNELRELLARAEELRRRLNE